MTCRCSQSTDRDERKALVGMRALVQLPLHLLSACSFTARSGAFMALHRDSAQRAWAGHGDHSIFALHKPKGVSVELKSPATRAAKGRTPVLNDWIEEAERLAHEAGDAPAPIRAVGRLDKATTGLLLLTSDGRLAEALLRPGLQPKAYEATVKLRAPAEPTAAMFAALRRGVELDDGCARAEHVELLERWRLAPPPAARLRYGVGARKRGAGGGRLAAEAGERTAELTASGDLPVTNVFRIRIVVRMGRHRVVRRMLAAAGLPVYSLHRTALGPLHLCRDLGLDEPGRLIRLSEAQELKLRRACAEGLAPTSIGSERQSRRAVGVAAAMLGAACGLGHSLAALAAGLSDAKEAGLPLVGRFAPLKGATSFIGPWRLYSTEGPQGVLVLRKDGDAELRASATGQLLAASVAPWTYKSPQGSDTLVRVLFSLDVTDSAYDDVLYFEGLVDSAAGPTRELRGTIRTGFGRLVGDFSANPMTE
jgi:23S rRNA pseudouridine2457 synthase